MQVVNIIKRIPLDGDYKIALDERVLGEILQHPKVANCPVALYSIAGPFRSGKSFLLNLFVNYLLEQVNKDACDRAAEENKAAQTEGGNTQYEDKTLEKWFSWKGGLDCHTEGIHILNEPFLLGSEAHPKVALFLMDTQGLFDHKEATQNSARIGALSFLISSVQLFNIMSQLDGNHLQYIYRFSKFAKEIKNHDGVTSPFQSLLFLIRDWRKKRTFEHGFEGGEKYIEHIMKTNNNQALEHKFVRDDLYETFGSISCSLLPPPGEEVEETDQPAERFCVEDINSKFLEKATELFEKLCLPENLVPKTINGQYVTGKELFYYITEYSAIINDGLEENVQSFLVAGYNAKLKSVIDTCSEDYRRKMARLACTEWKEPKWENLAESHKNLKNEALIFFDEQQKPGDEEFLEKWRQDLEVLIDSNFKVIREYITTTFRVAIDDYLNVLQSGSHFKGMGELAEQNKQTIKRIVASFNNQVDADIAEVFCEAFQKEAAVIYNKIQETNQRNRKMVGTVAGAAAGAAAVAGVMLFPPAAAVVGAFKLASPLVVGTSAAVLGKVGNMITTKLDEDEVKPKAPENRKENENFTKGDEKDKIELLKKERQRCYSETEACKATVSDKGTASRIRTTSCNVEESKKNATFRDDHNITASTCDGEKEKVKSNSSAEQENSFALSEDDRNKNIGTQTVNVSLEDSVLANSSANDEDISFQQVFSTLQSFVNIGKSWIMTTSEPEGSQKEEDDVCNPEKAQKTLLSTPKASAISRSETPAERVENDENPTSDIGIRTEQDPVDRSREASDLLTSADLPSNDETSKAFQKENENERKHQSTQT